MGSGEAEDQEAENSQAARISELLSVGPPGPRGQETLCLSHKSVKITLIRPLALHTTQ